LIPLQADLAVRVHNEVATTTAIRRLSQQTETVSPPVPTLQESKPSELLRRASGHKYVEPLPGTLAAPEALPVAAVHVDCDEFPVEGIPDARVQKEPLQASKQRRHLRSHLCVAMEERHPWASIWWRNPFSKFVGVERLTVQFSEVMAMLVLNAFLFSDAGGGFDPSEANQYVVPLVSAILRKPWFVIIKLVFKKAGHGIENLRLRKGERLLHREQSALELKLERNRQRQQRTWPQWLRYVFYGVLVAWAGLSIPMVLVFGLRFNALGMRALNYERVWITSCAVSVLLNATILGCMDALIWYVLCDRRTFNRLDQHTLM
jgi:hypothetical protein